MKWKLNVTKKLLAGFLSVLLLMGVITGITFVDFTIVDKGYSTAIADNLKKLNLITDMGNAVFKQQIAVRDFLVNGNEDNIEQFNMSGEIFTEKANEYLSLSISNEAKGIIEEFIDVEVQYRQVAEEAIQYKRLNQSEEVARLMKESGNALTANVTEIGEKARLYQVDNTEKTSISLSKDVNKSKYIVLGISIIALIIGLAVSLYISRIISLPVRKIAESAEQIAKGNLVIEEINIRNNDEIGDLAVSFNQMTKNLRDLIENVSQTSEKVASSAEELMASAEQTSSATEQVTASIMQVATGAEVQGKATEESANAISEMTVGINRIASTTSNVAEFATVTTSQATVGNEMLQKVVKQMESINQSTNQTNSVIKELDNNSNEIDKIIDVITGIAEQTNLLALNAAIESARAGEHGKGFAVVADEVRKLAEQSRASASQISNLVKLIQSDVLKVVEMMNKETEEVNEGMSLVSETGKSFRQILSSIDDVSSKIHELSVVSEQMSAGVEQVNSSIDEVSRIAKSSVKNTSEIAASSEEQLATMEEVTASASTLAKMAEDLREMLQTFKIK